MALHYATATCNSHQFCKEHHIPTNFHEARRLGRPKSLKAEQDGHGGTYLKRRGRRMSVSLRPGFQTGQGYKARDSISKTNKQSKQRLDRWSTG